MAQGDAEQPWKSDLQLDQFEGILYQHIVAVGEQIVDMGWTQWIHNQ